MRCAIILTCIVACGLTACAALQTPDGTSWVGIRYPGTLAATGDAVQTEPGPMLEDGIGLGIAALLGVVGGPQWYAHVTRKRRIAKEAVAARNGAGGPG